MATLYRWQSGYRVGLDRDNDGVACEQLEAALQRGARLA
nr:excalibur calcium-binding domain-containing protein [Lentzea californiensis]